MRDSRIKQIETLITQQKNMTMQELKDIFGVSMNTIRSDVAQLVKSGVVEKVYGGIRLRENKDTPLFANRASQNTDAKIKIACAAERLIENGDVIYIDSGTTTMHILDYLDPSKHISLVTPSIPVIEAAARMENVDLFILPGKYDPRTNSILDGSTAEYLARYQHAKCFMGVTYLSPNGTLGVSSYLMYELKRTALARSQSAFLLADSSKYGNFGLLSYGTISQMNMILTDSEISPEFVEYCSHQNVPLMLI